MQKVERDRRHLLRERLMTMETAAAVAFERIFGREPLISSTPQVRARIAHALAAIVPVYTFNEDKSEFQQLEYADMKRGIFFDGGRSFQYADERPTLHRIAINQTDLPDAISRLRDIRGLLEELMR